MKRDEPPAQEFLDAKEDAQALANLLSILDINATDLANQALHEQPKVEKDAIDHDEQWNHAISQVAANEPDPSKDWDTRIHLVQPRDKKKLQQQIDDHLEIALRQIALVSFTHQDRIPKIRQNIEEVNRRKIMLRAEQETMAKALTCAHQHVTAWRMLKDLRDNSPEARQEKARQAKQERKDEKEVMLRALIKGALTKHRPSGGWERYDLAAPLIANILLPLIEEYSLPLTDNIDLLSDNIQKLIFTEPSLRKAYNENGKQPVPEPHKSRIMTIKLR